MKLISKQPSQKALLGISIAPTSVHAILFRTTERRIEVINRFTRQRVDHGDGAIDDSLSSTLPDLQDDDDADVTFELGGSSASVSGFDLDDELSDLDGSAEDRDESGAGRRGSRPFTRQLRDILNECTAAGYPNPTIAFCIGAPDVTVVDLTIPADGEFSGGAGPENQYSPELSSSLRRRLLKLLEEKHANPFEDERTGFLPMTKKDGQNRYLALIPVSNDVVTTTLQLARKRDGFKVPPVRRVDTEIPVYLSLAETTLNPDHDDATAVIRVGTDDTLVLFIQGRQLRHVERLRSLTSFDSPDTVCSRVLLHQDEHKIGSLDHVLLLTEGRDEKMLGSFERFFPEARVQPLQALVQEKIPQLTSAADSKLTTHSTAAIGSAVQLLDETLRPFEPTGVNLLSKSLRGRRTPRLAAGWHTYLMMAVLFVVTLGAVWHYMDRQFELNREQEELRLNPPEMPDANPDRLQHRVDSLNEAYQTYTHALQVLDSLLVGSDRWSQMLEKVSASTNEVPGTWLKSWSPDDQHHLRLEGSAMSRSRVVELARRLEGQIERLEFAEIREHRIYPFTMVIPLPHETPEVATYLQTRVADSLQTRSGPSNLAADTPETLHEHRDGALH